MEDKELKKALSELGDSIDEKLDKLSAKTKELTKEEARTAIKEVKAELEGEIKKYNDLTKTMQDQLDAIEVKMGRVNAAQQAQKSFAELLKDKVTERLGEKKDGRKLRGVTFDFETKTVQDMLQSNTFESTIVVPVDYQPGIVYDPSRTVRLRDIISQGVTDSNMVSFVQEYAFDASDDVTTEGSEYKQSSFDLKRIDAAVLKITSYVLLSEELLEDVNGLTSYILARLPEKLRNEEDDQILNNATYGLLAKGTAYADNLADADISHIDVLVDSIRQVADDEYRASAILLHPTDATAMKLTKDDNGQYIFPWIFMNNGNVVVDGVPVVVTTAITAGTFLVGDFKRAAQIFDRRQLSVEFSNTNEDNFIKGMVTVRCSERIAIVVYRPKAFVYGTFTNALALGSA